MRDSHLIMRKTYFFSVLSSLYAVVRCIDFESALDFHVTSFHFCRCSLPF